MSEFKWTDELVAEYVDWCRTKYKSTIGEFKQSKQKQPIFKTEDGIDIYEDDKYWFVSNDFNVEQTEALNHHPKFYAMSSIKRFSTQTQAQQYVLLNKPCLSLNDVSGYVEFQKNLNELIELAKLKINK